MSGWRGFVAAGGALVALATVLGALGAHALQGRLGEQSLHAYDTAVRYHFYHALGLIAIGLTARVLDAGLLRWAGLFVIAGIVLFSGSLYALTFGAPRPLGAITPLGGLSLIAGWVLFVIAVVSARRV